MGMARGMSASIQPTSLCFSSFRKPALIRGGQRVEPIRQSCKRLDRLLCLGHLGGQVDGVPRGQFGGFRRLPFGSHLSPTSGFGETKLFCIRRIGVLVVTMAVASTSARA